MHWSLVVNWGWLMNGSRMRGFVVNWSLVHWSRLVRGCRVMHRSGMMRSFMMHWSGMMRRFMMDWSMDWCSVRGFMSWSLMVCGCVVHRCFVMRSLVVLHWRLLLLK